MKSSLVLAVTFVTLCLTGCAHKGSSGHKDESRKTVYNDQDTLRRYVSGWPVTSRFAVDDLMDKYGLPKLVTKEAITWRDSGYFKRSVVYREGITHNFPTPHEDVLQQFVGYRIPEDKVDDLWRFNGSLIVDRTRGEISSRCNREEMNVLALNLADNIIQNRMSVARAREIYRRDAMDFMNGNISSASSLTSGLQFSEYLNSGDPDLTESDRTIQAEEEGPGIIESDKVEKDDAQY